MTRFHFERPDGPPSIDVQNMLIHLNRFVPPQGFGAGGIPTGPNMLYETGGVMEYETDGSMEYET